MAQTYARRCPECGQAIPAGHRSWCSRWEPADDDGPVEADPEQYAAEEDSRLDQQLGPWPAGARRWEIEVAAAAVLVWCAVIVQLGLEAVS